MNQSNPRASRSTRNAEKGDGKRYAAFNETYGKYVGGVGTKAEAEAYVEANEDSGDTFTVREV